ncbi:MAG: GNAT family N-acetyltransferase [Candidatus Thiodiazotropha sp. (ex Monitilora ramsayi)]|nr:GNAT family N-acetyltransferase [Candidatus Thiodiazotropha sp. (ex Monitilora ramsayi)]
MTPDDNSPNQRLAESIVELQQKALARRHRHMIVIAGDLSWCLDKAHHLIEALNQSDALWIGLGAPGNIPAIENRQALQRLGSELDLMIYNAYSGFDPDAFGALSGTLRGGGFLLLLTPALEKWRTFYDPENARIAVAGYDAETISGNFLHRISQILRNDPSVITVSANGSSTPLPKADGVPFSAAPASSDSCLTEDQRLAVEAILHVAKGHRRRPLVLSSDRGRGKSSALGIAAARLILEGTGVILATAPRMAATDSLFQQARQLMPDAISGTNSLSLSESVLRYSAPDHLLANPVPADLLLVDEAAAIPTPVLESLLKKYARIVFATTVHGYEGTGRGFSVRFKAHLDHVTPSWRELTLSEPIRWAPDDPLEPLIFRLLALDANPAPDKDLSDANGNTVKLEIPQPHKLCKNEKDLGEIFGLLVLAHYRTTPLDLRLLLDGPNLITLILRHHSSVVGVALLAAEGGFDEYLANQIWAGHRRPRGHLLAQSLAAHVGVRTAPALKGLRIMRIAIHPAVQRRRLGSRLIDEIRQYAVNNEFDYIGTSFGASDILIDFWHQNRLLPVRLGLRSGASSGGHSIMMIEPLTSQGKQMAEEAKRRFAQQIPRLLGDSLCDISNQLAVKLLATMEQTHEIDISNQDWFDLAGYAFARRGYEASLPAIERLAMTGLNRATVTGKNAGLLVSRVLQKKSWQACSLVAGLNGRRETEQRLREIIAHLIETHDHEKIHAGIINQIQPDSDSSPES